MSDTPETFAAIIAQMHRWAKRGLAINPGYLADRLDAAAKRDAQNAMKTAFMAKCEVCEKLSPARPGNAAAMRESIETMRRYAMIPQEELSLSLLQRTIHEKCDAALAAPARNCDRFADEMDAQLAFLNDVWLISVEKETMLERDKFENWTEQMKTCYGRWLLAPAEGGSHA